MNNLKKLSAIIAAILICSFSMTGCNETETSSSVSNADSSSSSHTEGNVSAVSDSNKNENQTVDSDYFDEDDLDTSYDNPNAEITLNGTTAEIKGSGAEFSDKKISITAGGTYVLSGTLDDGQVYVNTKEKVHLVLNGTNISCSDSSPIFIEDSDNAVITVCDGTENTLSDTTNYVYENTDENEPDAVIYSKDDLAVNGSGTLNITANYNEGLTSKNDLRISGVTINVTSIGNSIKGKDSLAIMNAIITAESQSDGLKSSNAEETDKGYIAIESGEFNITAAQDGIQAETDLIINNGTFNIKTGSGAGEAANSETQQQFGDMGGMQAEGNSNTTVESEKGIKAGKTLTINGGEITADCTDDAIHSGDSIEINSGTFMLSSGDDGIHADTELSFNGGDVSVLQSYEGLESTVINVNDGKISIVASDDGFNASEGSSDETTTSDTNTSNGGQFGGFGGGGGFGDVSENCIFNINGGYIYVNAGGDGLDSNGVININGGTTIVDGPVNDGNASLDSGSEINVNGGTLIAAGSSGMAELPSDTSSQASLAIGFDQSQNAETIVCIQDESGNNIITYSPSKTYSSIIVSSPEITQGGTYSVYYGGSCSGAETDGLYSDGEYSGGTLLETVSADSIVTQIGTSTSGMMGGMGGGRGGNFSNPNGDTEFTPGEDMEMPDGITPPDGMEMPDGMTPPDGNFPGNADSNDNSDI